MLPTHEDYQLKKEKKMRQPQEVFEFFIKCLKEEVELQFDMSRWYVHPNLVKNYNKPLRVDSPSSVTNVCGTSACIAGTVAYRLDPSSEVNADKVVKHWVGNVGADYGEMEDALDYIFNEARLYGAESLEEVTKDDVLTLLEELHGFETWDEVNIEVEIILDNPNHFWENFDEEDEE